MTNEAMPTDGTTQQGQAVVYDNMQGLLDLEDVEGFILPDIPNPFPIDPLLLSPQNVADILHSYYAE